MNARSALMPSLRRVLTRYADLTVWVWRDAVRRYPSGAAVAVAAGGIALVFEVVAYAGLYAYARALETGQVVEWAGASVAVRDSYGVLVVVAAVVFVSFVVAAALNYVSGQRTITLWQRYELFCIKRAAVLTSRLPHPASPEASAQVSEGLLKTLEKDSRYCGRFFQLFLNGVLPLGRLALSAVALFVIDWLFTLIVLALAAVAQLYLHRINAANAAATRAYEARRTDARGGQKRLLHHLWRNVVPVGMDDPLLAATYESGPYRQSQQAYLVRWLAKEKTTLTVNLLGAVATLAVLLAAGVALLSGAWSWSLLLAYVAALRYFLGSLMQVSSLATTASRYYPHLFRYYTFEASARAATAAPPAAEPPPSIGGDGAGQPTVLALPALDGSADRVALHPGRPVLVFHPEDVDRGLLRALFEKATPPAAAPEPFWVVGDGTFQGGTLRSFAGIAPDVPPEALRSALARAAGHTAPTRIDPDTPLSPEDAAAVPPETLQRWRLAAALLSGRPAIVVPRKQKAGRVRWDVPSLRHRFPARIVVEVTDEPPAEPLPDAAAVLFSDGEALQAWGTGRYVNVHPEVWSRYSDASVHAREAVSADLDDDEE